MNATFSDDLDKAYNKVSAGDARPEDVAKFVYLWVKRYGPAVLRR